MSTTAHDDLPEGAWGYPKVQGDCPACHMASLFLTSGGYVTCANIPCPNPTAVSDRLERVKPTMGNVELSADAYFRNCECVGHHVNDIVTASGEVRHQHDSPRWLTPAEQVKLD